MAPPGPIPSHYVVIVVPTTFWLAIMMGGWPFNPESARTRRSSESPRASGATSLLTSCFASSSTTTSCKARRCISQSAPKGCSMEYPRWCSTSPRWRSCSWCCVRLVAAHEVSGVMKQPVLRVVWTVIALAGAAVAFSIGVTGAGGRPDGVLTQVTVPLSSGRSSFSSMLQNTLFCRDDAAQGVMNTIAAAAIAHPRQPVRVVDPHGDGPRLWPAGIRREIWLANALLSVTFPFLIYHAVFFGYWPRPRDATSGSEQAAGRVESA